MKKRSGGGVTLRLQAGRSRPVPPETPARTMDHWRTCSRCGTSAPDVEERGPRRRVLCVTCETRTSNG